MEIPDNKRLVEALVRQLFLYGKVFDQSPVHKDKKKVPTAEMDHVILFLITRKSSSALAYREICPKRKYVSRDVEIGFISL